MAQNEQKFVFEGRESRLDVFLAENIMGYSRSIIQNLIKKGAVSINQTVIRKPAWPLENGNVIEITWPKAGRTVSLKDLIIFEDKNMFVVNKPAGLLVHPQSPVWEETPEAVFTTEETLVSAILANPPQDFDPKVERAGLVHRLDRETSGIMLVAKNPQFQQEMTEMFASRQVHKTYNAICCGNVPDDEGTINVPIGRVTGGKIKASDVGRDAVTDYHVVERKNGFSYMELMPRTGRTNQLRVHMSWLGYPVLGDWLYKGATADRLMLHAKKLEFKNPLNGKKMKFEVEPPEDFLKTWKKMTAKAK